MAPMSVLFVLCCDMETRNIMKPSYNHLFSICCSIYCIVTSLFRPIDEFAIIGKCTVESFSS